MSQEFRKVFQFPAYKLHNWFPGHMHKGMTQMQCRIGDMDCVVEIHDARVPFTGRNPLFQRQAKMRPHLLILNKIDLCDKNILNFLKSRDLGASKVLYADLKNKTHSTADMLLEAIMDLACSQERFSHNLKKESYSSLVTGVPNVGKSSLINLLRNVTLRRKGRPARIGANPGITKSVMEKIRILDEPLVYLYDTPGILVPNIKETESALKLSCCNIIEPRILGEHIVADYLLYKLNQLRIFRYVEHYNLTRASDDVTEVMEQIATKHDKFIKKKIDGQLQTLPHTHYSMNIFLRDFNKGLLGKVNFDLDLPLELTESHNVS